MQMLLVKSKACCKIFCAFQWYDEHIYLVLVLKLEVSVKFDTLNVLFHSLLSNARAGIFSAQIVTLNSPCFSQAVRGLRGVEGREDIRGHGGFHRWRG